MIYFIRVITLKKIILDYRTSEIEKNSLLKLGYDILICPPSHNLYYAVCGHPDMLLHIIDDKNIIVHKNMSQDFIKELNLLNINVLFSNSSLKNKYPFDIVLNAVNFSDYFVHYTKYTDKNLLEIMDKKGKNLLSVKQGYTKCSTAIISDHAIITSDTSIAKLLSNENIDVLLLPPGDISLPGLDYGFIGGTCGLIEDNVLAFFGDLEFYAYGNDVLKFLKKHNVEPVFLRKGKLIDRGSLFAVTSNH